MSKAKEEAEMLVELYHEHADYYIDLSKEDSICDLNLNKTKCALIHVEGIISALVGLTSIKFYQEVKQELNKML